MNLCIPVAEDKGLQSPVSSHFGSAALFVIVDTENGRLRAVPNVNQDHAHGMCRPLQSLSGEAVDGVAVGGIGRGALGRLLAAGLRVFLTESPTVDETLAAFRAGSLREATPEAACGGHGAGMRGEEPCCGKRE